MMEAIKNILDSKLPEETIAYILHLLGEDWGMAVKELGERYFPKSESNLTKYLISELLVQFIQNKDDALVKELNYMSRNFRALQKAVENSNGKNHIFGKRIFENNELKEFINIFQIEDEKLLLSCKEFLKKNSWWWSTKLTKRNTKYSVAKWCITKLSELYFILKKEIPECRYNSLQEGTECEFSGEFYAFLLEITPLLKRVGIDLGKESSIGENARTIIRNNRKNYINPQV